MNEVKFLTVGQVSKRLGILPKHVTDAFYAGKLRNDICQVVSGRRLIPDWYVEHIERVLRREGKLAMTQEGGLNGR